jgi:hypothetical protein
MTSSNTPTGAELAPENRPIGARLLGSPRTRSLAIVALLIVGFAVVATAIVLIAGATPVREYPADSPEGTIQRYIRALDERDLDNAYALLSGAAQGRFSRAQFSEQQYAYGSYGDGSGRLVRIDRTEVTGDRATVALTIEQFWGGGFGSNRTVMHRTIRLVREPGGWRLDEALVGPELMPAWPASK